MAITVLITETILQRICSTNFPLVFLRSKFLRSRKSVEKKIPVIKNFNENSRVLYTINYKTLPLGCLLGIVDLTCPKEIWFSTHATPNAIDMAFIKKLKTCTLPMLSRVSKWHHPLNPQSQIPVNIWLFSFSHPIHKQINWLLSALCHDSAFAYTSDFMSNDSWFFICSLCPSHTHLWAFPEI